MLSIVMGAAFSTESLSAYVHDPLTRDYLLGNASLLDINYKLPGVFGANAYADVINGSLWTLPWEVKMYVVLVAAVKLSGRYLHRTVLALAVCGAGVTLLNYFCGPLTGKKVATAAPFVACFFGGACLCLWKDDFEFKPRAVLLSLGAIAALLAFSPRVLFYPALLLLLPYVTVGSALLPSGPLRNYNKLGDYSYGVYIYAFPVEQAIAALRPDLNALQLFLYAALPTLLLAVGSWHLIEKRSLRLKRRSTAPRIPEEQSSQSQLPTYE